MICGMTVHIEFTDVSGFVSKEFYPTPAKQSLPHWYSDLKPFESIDAKKEITQTAKRCVPILDSFTTGYIIYTPTDVEVMINNEGRYVYRWAHKLAIEFQALWQVGKHSGGDDRYDAIPKMPNPWGVKTPSGYSCMYIPPMNRDDAVFEIFAGVVDTDKFHQNGSMPFLLKEKDFEGVIPAGTPMAQVVPFRRESYEMSFGDDTQRVGASRQLDSMRTVFINAYRKFMWSPKSYK